VTALLASVRSLDEALLALEGGADLIDLKEPSRGALGALDHAAVRVCVQVLRGRSPASATVGDLPDMDPAALFEAASRIAATGVDFVKIGFFRHPQAHACAHALAPLARQHRLVAVLFAEDCLDEPLLDRLAANGFAGAMLDTARKTGRTLLDWKHPAELARFIGRARARGLLAGLAGSLGEKDVPALLALEPDYLGFRGALCGAGVRVNALDAGALARIRQAIPRGQSQRAGSRSPARPATPATH
jgi:dihydroneopterin aldolase